MKEFFENTERYREGGMEWDLYKRKMRKKISGKKTSKEQILLINPSVFGLLIVAWCQIVISDIFLISKCQSTKYKTGYTNINYIYKEY